MSRFKVGDRVLFHSDEPGTIGDLFGRVAEVIGVEDITVYLIRPEILIEGTRTIEEFSAWENELTLMKEQR